MKLDKNEIRESRTDKDDEVQIPGLLQLQNTANKFLSQRRCISLTGTISENSAENFIASLMRLEMEDPVKDILVIINSYGGYIHAAWSMIDAMNLLRCNIHTLTIGKAMSAGSLVLMNGTKGKRYSAPHSSIMIHRLRGETYGIVDDMEVDVQETRRIQNEIEEFICKKTKIKKADLKGLIDKDFYITPKKALEMGIIDKVIDKFGDIKLKGW